MRGGNVGPAGCPSLSEGSHGIVCGRRFGHRGRHRAVTGLTWPALRGDAEGRDPVAPAYSFVIDVLNHLPVDRRAPWRRDYSWRRGIWAKG